MTEPASTERLRRQNVSLVLRSLRRQGPATRTELAQRTGLAKATIGAIVSGLEDARAVTEEESRTGARGRPGRPVRLRAAARGPWPLAPSLQKAACRPGQGVPGRLSTASGLSCAAP